jgi:hexosaminidase
MQCRLNALFLATVAVYLSAGLSPARAAKAEARPAAAEEPVKTVKGKQVTLEFRESDFKLLKSQAEFLAFLDSVYERMQELTYASPPMILRGHKNLGAWGTAGLDGVRIDWTCVPGFMTGFNTGMIEFGVVHEIGHVFDARNFPRWYITPGCGGETFGNIKLSYALEMLLRKDNAYRIEFGPGGKQTGYDFNNNFYLPAGKKYLASDTPWEKLGVDELHAFHMTLIRKYGWDVYKKWFRAYYLIEAQKDGRAPPSCNDPVRINLVCALLSAFSGDNLVADFQQWRMPVTEASVNEVRKRYQLSDVCPAVEKQFAKEYAEGKITLDPLSLRVTAEPVANKTMSAIGFFSAVKIDGAVVRYTLDNSEVGSLFTKSYQGTPVTVNKPVTVNAALFVPGKKEPVLTTTLKVTPVFTPAPKPVSAAVSQRLVAGPASFASAKPPAAGAGPELALVPWPKSVKKAQGQLALTPATRIMAADNALVPLAALLSAEMDQVCGLKLAPAGGAGKAGDLVLALDPSLTGEAYVLEITVGKAVVRGANYNAVALGTVTLLQALTQSKSGAVLPAMTVHDAPQSEYCGTMVDVARRFNSIDSLKQVVLLCRLYKIRYLHLHLTDDQAWTFPSKAFPKLGTTPQFMDGRGHAPYTHAELGELVSFADARGVTIVPEIEMPGHSGSLQRDLPDVFGVMNAKTGKKAGCGVINIANEEIYPVLDTLIGEVCEVFKSSPYFHMGSDECYWPPFLETAEYKEYAQKSGLKTPREMVGKFAARINEMVKKRGKRLISWESYGGSLEKDIIIMAWRGGHDEIIRQGFKIINVPWVPQVYYTPRANFEWSIWMMGPEGCTRPTEMQKTDDILKGVIGAQQVLWERGGDESLRLLRQTAPARNEQVYNPGGGRTYEDFKVRLRQTEALLDKLAVPVGLTVAGLREPEGMAGEDLSDTWGRNNEQMMQRDGNVVYTKELTVTLTSLSAQRGQTIRYTLDGSEPTASSAAYSAPFKLAPDAAQVTQATHNRQYRIDTTLRARLFAGTQPVGFARVATYSYNLVEHLPQSWKFTLYPAEAKLKKAPAELTGQKPIYVGTTYDMNLREMWQFNYPTKLVCVWEGTANMKKGDEYTFKLRSFAATSQLFVDGKLLIDRTADDWGQDFGKVQLSAGKHAIKVIRCGTAHYQSLGLIRPDQSQEALDMEPVKP